MSEIKGVDFESYVMGWNDRIRYREGFPSAEKTGHWIQNDNGTWSCDQCHSWIPDEQHYYARYCLYCGVKMKGNQGGII